MVGGGRGGGAVGACHSPTSRSGSSTSILLDWASQVALSGLCLGSMKLCDAAVENEIHCNPGSVSDRDERGRWWRRGGARRYLRLERQVRSLRQLGPPPFGCTSAPERAGPLLSTPKPHTILGVHCCSFCVPSHSRTCRTVPLVPWWRLGRRGSMHGMSQIFPDRDDLSGHSMRRRGSALVRRLHSAAGRVSAWPGFIARDLGSCAHAQCAINALSTFGRYHRRQGKGCSPVTSQLPVSLPMLYAWRRPSRQLATRWGYALEPTPPAYCRC